MSWTLENDLLEAEGNVVTLRGEGLGLGSLVTAMWVEDPEEGAAVQCWRFQVLAASAGTVWAGVCRGGKLGPGLGGDSLLYGGPGHLLPNTAPDWGPSVGSGDTLDIRLGLEDRAVNPVNQPSQE